MFSFGVAHPVPFFSIAEPFSKGKQIPIWREERSTLWPENEFFKSNMDALIVLSIWDTGCNSYFLLIVANLWIRARGQEFKYRCDINQKN